MILYVPHKDKCFFHKKKIKIWSQAFMVCKEEIDDIEQKYVAISSKKRGCVDVTFEVIAKMNVQVSRSDSSKNKTTRIPSFEQFDIHNDLLHKNPSQPKD